MAPKTPAFDPFLLKLRFAVHWLLIKIRGKRAANPRAADKVWLVINKTVAREMGFTIPPTLLALADEVIEWPVAPAQDRNWHRPNARFRPLYFLVPCR